MREKVRKWEREREREREKEREKERKWEKERERDRVRDREMKLKLIHTSSWSETIKLILVALDKNYDVTIGKSTDFKRFANANLKTLFLRMASSKDSDKFVRLHNF